MELTQAITDLINGIIEREGGYVNDPADKGGETNYGITVAVARAHGYSGSMRDLPRQMAFDIYLENYYRGPRFDQIAKRSAALAEELTDTGVNMGQGTAVKLLQTALNAFNLQGELYPDLAVDGFIGAQTLVALDAFLARRGKEGERVLCATVDHLQAARYIELSITRQANERFVYGWILNRTNVA